MVFVTYNASIANQFFTVFTVALKVFFMFFTYWYKVLIKSNKANAVFVSSIHTFSDIVDWTILLIEFTVPTPEMTTVHYKPLSLYRLKW